MNPAITSASSVEPNQSCPSTSSSNAGSTMSALNTGALLKALHDLPDEQPLKKEQSVSDRGIVSGENYLDDVFVEREKSKDRKVPKPIDLKTPSPRSSRAGPWRSPSDGPSSADTDRVRGYSAAMNDVQFRVRDVDYLNTEDAQAIYPHSACVFVANLLASSSDLDLECEVTKVFKVFGTVYVKVRRDQSTMPFAFCQFTNEKDAERAYFEGRGLRILGRPCRTEVANGNTKFVLIRKEGAIITVAEARTLLAAYGSIVAAHSATAEDRARAVTNDEGVFVVFEKFAQGQAALAAFRNHPEFKLLTVLNKATAPTSPSSAEFIKNYSAVRRSVFIGNVPANLSEDGLRAYLEPYGPVESVVFHYKPSIKKSEERYCFAFVEFQKDSSVYNVVEALNGSLMDGNVLKVSRKNSSSRLPRTPCTPYAPRTEGPSTPMYASASIPGPLTPMVPNTPDVWSQAGLTPYTSPFTPQLQQFQRPSPWLWAPEAGMWVHNPAYSAENQSQYGQPSPYSPSPYVGYGYPSAGVYPQPQVQYSYGSPGPHIGYGQDTGYGQNVGYGQNIGYPQHFNYGQHAGYSQPYHSPPASTSIVEEKPLPIAPVGETSEAAKTGDVDETTDEITE